MYLGKKGKYESVLKTARGSGKSSIPAMCNHQQKRSIAMSVEVEIEFNKGVMNELTGKAPATM